MSRTRTLSISVVASLLAACGGGGDSPASGDETAGSPQGATTAPVTEPVVTEPIVTSATAVPTTITTTTTPNTTTTTVIVDVTEATPWLVDLPDPVGLMLAAWADQPALVHTPTEPPERVEAQLTWLYTDLIALWRENPQLSALGLNTAALERPHRETAPAAAIDLIGAAGAFLRDTYAVIAADAELAAATGSAGQQMFAAWSELAGNWVIAGETVRVAMVEALDYSADDQECFVVTIDGDDSCEGPAAEWADAMLSDLGVSFQAIDQIEIDEIRSYASGLGIDECAAWDAAIAATGLTPDEELRIWLGIDDNDLDRLFVGLSECGWQHDGEEDPQADEADDQATFLTYLTAVAEAVVDSGYDETVYDFGSGAEDERRHYESTSAEATQAILTAARDAGSQLWSTAYDTEFATKLYVVARLEIDDWTQLGDRRLDWDDLGNRVCDGWEQVIEDYSDEQLTAIDAAVSELGLDGTLIPEDCA